MRHDEMTCICGEVLTTEEQSDKCQTETGKLWEQYQEHLRRPDHAVSPAQWAEAADRMSQWKEKAKKERAAVSAEAR